jgi:hypothetical protein
MLGTNERDTDMDIIVILPKIIVYNEGYDPIFSGYGNSILQHLKSIPQHRAYYIGGRIPLIRLFYENQFYGTIQSM